MKFAFYADVNLNLIDGSAIWLTSVTQILASIPKTEIYLYLKAPIENSVNIDPLFEIPNISIIPPMLSPNQRSLTPQDALDRLCKDDATEKYDAFFLRGFDLCHLASDIPQLSGKLWVYFTEVPVDSAQITEPRRGKIDRIIESAQYLLTQTPQLREHLEKHFPKAKSKTRNLPPMIPSPGRQPFRPKGRAGIRIVYSGQFKREYASLEMFEIFRQIVAEFPDTELHVYGEKIHNPPEDAGFREAVLRELTTCPNLRWHKALGRDEVLAEFADMDIGWAWRKDVLEAHTLEISTKLLEFSSYGLPPIMARNRINEAVFGADYPLFANSHAEALEKIRLVLRDPALLEPLRERVCKLVAPFQFDYIRTHHLEPLCRPASEIEKAKAPLLGIVGHDLKFLDTLAARFSAKADVVKHHWWGHRFHDVKASEDLVREADIIFCEWFLGNAVWYSKHKRAGQKLIVRFHRQELETVYPAEADIEKIDQVVIVSDHTRRDAIAKFGWEEYGSKIIVIPNAINCAYFNRPKLKESLYNIGIVGITPRLKRLDLALDVLEKCRAQDPRFRLVVKGKYPTEYAWLRHRPDELAYFAEQLERIKTNPLLAESVVFDGWGANMGEWYRKVGFILSVSDLEGTHQAVAEGGASGALPIIRNWDGADEVYRQEWVYADIAAMADKIVEYTRDRELRITDTKHCIDYMERNFDVSLVAQRYAQIW